MRLKTGIEDLEKRLGAGEEPIIISVRCCQVENGEVFLEKKITLLKDGTQKTETIIDKTR